MQTQQEIELEAYQFGKERMTRSIANNEEKGRANNNPYAQAIYRRFVLPLAEIIREDLDAKKPGRRQAHVALLRPLDPEAVAYLAVRQTLVLLLAAKGDDAQGREIVASVGRSVYHEYLLTHFEDAAPDLFHALVNDFERRLSVNERHRMTVFKMQAKQNGIEFNEWGSGDRDQVGSYLVEQLTQLGMVESRMQVQQHANPKNIKTYIHVEMSPECEKLIGTITDFAVESTPYFLPCVEPPRDWRTVVDGGFHTKELRRLMPWVVKCHPSMRDNFREADMSVELDAVNTLQRVEWRINKRVLDAVSNVARHFDMDEIISQAEAPKPDKPDWLVHGMERDDMQPDQLEEFTAWKRSVAEWHTERKVRGTKIGRFYNAMRVARKFAEYDKLWFVYFLDFRGRKYVQTTGVSPQGSDLQKSLLEFANGKPLLTPEAVMWFKVAGANRWGYDKVTLQDRVKWVDERKEMLLAFARDPVSNSGWQEADAPLQFLAWCMEYADWCALGSTFKSRLAVGMDGSCNGLQNFSAMLRDTLGGKATNLIPSPLPNDIYQMVADVTSRLLQAASVDEHGYRDRWLKHGMNRTLVKRSVMTLPYGSTRYSCADFIVGDYLRAGKVPEFEKNEYQKAAQYLSVFVWQAIGEVVVKAREAMDWLQKASRQLLKSGEKEIRWRTPSGFPAIQTYWEQDVRQIRTRLCGGAILRMSNDADRADLNRHKNGVAPNVVHSLDASHLTLTVRACKAAGIDSLWMVHDDYGTHAADADALYRLIRESFVAMYSTHDPLAEFQAAYPILPEPPSKGDLDITQVLDSTYFFA